MKCAECGKEFTPKRKQQRFCDTPCRAKYNSRIYGQRHRKKINYERRQRYKKNPEKERAYSRSHPKPEDRKEKTCVVCGKKFKPLSARHPHQKYCGPKCRIRENDRKCYYKDRKKAIAIVLKSRNRSETSKQAHRDSVRKYTWARRKTIEQLEYNLTPADQRAIRERDGNACVFCGSTEKSTLDHIKPILAGGLDIKENVVVACQKCNSSRQHRDVFDWCGSKGTDVPTKVTALLAKQFEMGVVPNTNIVSPSLYDIRESMPKLIRKVNCAHCGKVFETTNRKKKHCDKSCRMAAYRKLKSEPVK